MSFLVAGAHGSRAMYWVGPVAQLLAEREIEDVRSRIRREAEKTYGMIATVAVLRGMSYLPQPTNGGPFKYKAVYQTFTGAVGDVTLTVANAITSAEAALEIGSWLEREVAGGYDVLITSLLPLRA